MSARQNPTRDKRVSKLTKESAKLRQEITDLEDALILHSRFQAEDDTSIRGMIRKEVGGSRWEHGGEGRLHTYRGNKDLSDRGRLDKGKRVKDKSSISQSHRKEPESHRTPSLNVKPRIQQDSVGSKDENDEEKAVDKTCLNGEWALKSERVAKKTKHNIDKLGESEFGNLKNKVLAKASAKVIKRKDFGLEKKSSRLLDVSSSSKENAVRNSNSNKSKELKERKGESSNNAKNDISYSLSFLESLHETETKDSNSPYAFSTVNDRKGREKDAPNLPDDVDGGKNSTITNDDIICCIDKNINSRDDLGKHKDESFRWATERDKVSKDISQQGHPRTMRRNSVGGMCQKDTGGDLKDTPKSRLSQPVSGFEKDFDSNSKDRSADFPLLFGSVHKTLDDRSQILGGSVHVSLNDESSKLKHTQEDDDFFLSGKGSFAKSTKQSIIIIDEEVQSWLENLGLQDIDSYVTLFSDHEMDMSTIKLLTAGRLREMGIHALGPIMKLMKGVQVLNRDSTLKEDVHNEDIDVDTVKNSMSDISHSDKALDKREVTNDDETSRVPDKNVKESLNQKAPKASPSTLGWKKTSDEAEFVNLNDRSPVNDVGIPQAVSVKQKPKKTEKDKKAVIPSKSGQKKTKPTMKLDGKVKDDSQSASKVVKKPPVKAKDGIISAHEKYLDRKKLGESKTQTDQATSARQRQLRDKMAARHSSRRSSSQERRVWSSRSQPEPSLNTTMPECTNQQDVMTSSTAAPEKVEDLLTTKSLAVTANIGESSRGNKTATSNTTVEEDASLIELLDTKNLDQAMEKLSDSANAKTKESLNLSIVRQLKQQLHHIERHLVEKMEQPDGENSAEKSPEEIKQHRKNLDRDSNVRTSARERRRQRTPKEFSTTLEENSNIAKEFLKVGGIISHRKMKDDESPDGNKEEDARRNECSAGLKNGTSKILNVEQEASPYSIDNNSRKSMGEFSRTVTNTETHILDNIHANKLSRQTDLSRGKLAIAQEYLRKIEIDKKDISFETKDLLGDGAFSQVYKGVYQGSEVAIKQLKTSLTSNDKNYFSAEVSLLQDLRHPHVVMLLGVCTAHVCPVLVLEFMQGGNLYDRIHDGNLFSFSKDEFCLISRDIASGVCYLHNHRPPVLHLDLKSRNVLLGLGNRAKVADFGFSKWKVESDIRVSRSSKAKLSTGSPAWMAPELLSAGDITPKADVYSFSLVLWEMLAREDPYRGCSTFQILERVRMCQRPTIPSGCPLELKTLMEKCWEQNPCTRPTFKEILPDLDKLSSCGQWAVFSQESPEKMDKNRNNNLRGSPLPVGEARGTVRERNSSDTGEKTNVQFDNGDSCKFDLDHAHNKINENLAKAGEDSLNKEELYELPLDDKNTEMFNKNVSKNPIVLPASAMPLSELIPSITSPNESERIENTKFDEDDVPDLQEMEIQTQEKETHPSPQASNVTPPQSSTAQVLLASDRDTKKLDELLNKYLPSPRLRDHSNSMKKGMAMSSSGDASRKLLPLRQSLDKARKPPKPGAISNTPMSQSENFGGFSNGDASVSDKMLEEMKAIAKLSLNKEDSSQSKDSAGNGLGQSNQNLETTDDSSVEETNEQTSSWSRTSLSSLEKNRQQNEVLDLISSLNLNIPSEEPQHIIISQNSPDVNKTVEASWPLSSSSSSFKNFTDVTKEIEETLSLVHSITTTPRSLTPNSSPPNLMNVKTSIQDNEQMSKNDESLSFRDKPLQPNSSQSMVSETAMRNQNFSEYVEGRTSISTDMSVDSLSLSLSDDADSLIDFSKNNSLHLSGKKTKPKDGKIQPSLMATRKTDQSRYASSPRRNNDNKSEAETNPNGAVRESFFLFNDFHLDLNQLNDNYDNSDADETTHTTSPPRTLHVKKSKNRHLHAKDISSHQPTLSPTRTQHEGNLSQISDSHQHQRKQFKKYEEVSRSPQTQITSHNHSPKAGMNPMPKESIHLSNKRRDTHTQSHTIPPPPPAPPLLPPPLSSLTSHQIKKYARDHSNPVKSGIPNKSASTKPEVQGHSRFSVEPGLLLQQRNKLKSVLQPELSPLKELSYGRSIPSVASILKKAMDERRVAMGDNHESQEVLTTPEASWSLQD